MVKISIGTAQLGTKYGISNISHNGMKLSDFKKIIKYSLKKKINILDTANTYFNSEKKIGKVVKELNCQKQLKIITKLHNLKSIPAKQIEKKIINKCKLSIKKLKIKKLYAVLIHDIKDLKSTKSKIIFKSILKLKKIGLVQKIGFSSYEINDLNKYIIKYKFDIIQFPFNIFDQRILKKKTQLILKKRKIEVHIRSIFLQGLLLMPYDKVPSKLKNSYPILKKWHTYLNEQRVENLEACIKFISNYNFFKTAVIGFENYNQFIDVVKKFNNVKKKKIFVDFKKFRVNTNIINPSKW